MPLAILHFECMPEYIQSTAVVGHDDNLDIPVCGDLVERLHHCWDEHRSTGVGTLVLSVPMVRYKLR
jgi:hypothetical protein